MCPGAVQLADGLIGEILANDRRFRFTRIANPHVCGIRLAFLLGFFVDVVFVETRGDEPDALGWARGRGRFALGSGRRFQECNAQTLFNEVGANNISGFFARIAGPRFVRLLRALELSLVVGALGFVIPLACDGFAFQLGAQILLSKVGANNGFSRFARVAGPLSCGDLVTFRFGYGSGKSGIHRALAIIPTAFVTASVGSTERLLREIFAGHLRGRYALGSGPRFSRIRGAIGLRNGHGTASVLVFTTTDEDECANRKQAGDGEVLEVLHD